MKTFMSALLISLANVLPLHFKFSGFRNRLFRWAGIEASKNVIFNGPLVIHGENARNLSIGAGSYLNVGIRIGCPHYESPITIGKNCAIGPYCMLETVNHGLVFGPGKGRGTFTKPITLEDEVWLGAGCIVLQGVQIGKGSVIASGSVVTKDIPEKVLAGGTPCEIIREIK